MVETTEPFQNNVEHYNVGYVLQMFSVYESHELKLLILVMELK